MHSERRVDYYYPEGYGYGVQFLRVDSLHDHYDDLDAICDPLEQVEFSDKIDELLVCIDPN